ncbi:unnamed protein product [Linum tenue]|uniref:Asparagine synthetase [glutamine-hydrolyzing] n=1 Tax=Linum tenue TaxID=586396 RepID=A0AAV0PR08_9ROSI|nr:unnamed protein product [Linum tenue]
MCGILAVFGCVDNSQAKRSRIIELSRRLRHRGPDWSGLHCYDDCYLAHQRLAIIDPASGDQPLYNEDKTVVVTVNGEIYNHKELREKLTSHQFRTGSDCEVIAHLYEEYGEDFVHMLDGMFSFVLLDTRNKTFIAARDAIGITPLYMGWGLDGSVWFASEMKALSDDCERFVSFLPGHIYSSKEGLFLGLEALECLHYLHKAEIFLANEKHDNFLSPALGWCHSRHPYYGCSIYARGRRFNVHASGENASFVLSHSIMAVTKRLMTDVPFGVLLSGGLDSSLVAAVASRKMAELAAACQWGTQLHTFCVGLKGSPDLRAAREVADYLHTRHHEFHFTVQEGIDALEEVIYHIETYDVTTIRASTPMFLMSRKIKSLGVKMVLSGEGSDEIFGGYLYFHKAPNKEELHKETCRKIKALHLYDCLRANKSTSAWGLEARVPFLDKEFINVAMSIDPEWKMIRPNIGRIEKWILRNAFDDEKNPYLPKHILYRQKEQFSDGVGYSWIDGLKDHANNQVTDAMLVNASFVYPENTPTTKEAYYYRTIFEKFFPKNAARATVPGGPSVACSTATAVEWDAAWSKNLDPSGRAAIGVHDAAYEDAAKTPSAMNGA